MRWVVISPDSIHDSPSVGPIPGQSKVELEKANAVPSSNWPSSAKLSCQHTANFDDECRQRALPPANLHRLGLSMPGCWVTSSTMSELIQEEPVLSEVIAPSCLRQPRRAMRSPSIEPHTPELGCPGQPSSPDQLPAACPI